MLSRQAQLTIHASLIEPAVFGLDRWLRQRQGVCEFTDNPQCLFRIQPAQLETEVLLADGTRLPTGAPVLNLHLWNEHLPPIGPHGATLKWARTLAKGVDRSLQELAMHLRRTRALEEVTALRADMRLGTAAQSAQLTRIVARYGLEPGVGGPENHGTLQQLAENMFIMLLVLAANPASLRAPILRRSHTPVYVSRLALLRRYAETAGLGDRGASSC